MAELEKIQDRKDKFSEFQKLYNSTSKGLARLIGTNAALFVCILIPFFMVAFIWTDFGLPTIGVKFVSEGIVTIALFVIGEAMMMSVGGDCGKLDEDYINAKKELSDLISKVNDVGTSFMNDFCNWQIDLEFEHATITRLRSLHIPPREWETIKAMPYDDIMAKYGRKKAKKIKELIDLPPIELDECILLYDNIEEGRGRGGVPISAEGYLYKHMHSIHTILRLLFTGLLTVSFAITLTSDLSWARVVYTAFRLVVLLSRMASGYSRGAKAYNRIEVGRINAICNYLRQYLRFVNEKIYLSVTDKYGVFVEAPKDIVEKEGEGANNQPNVA